MAKGLSTCPGVKNLAIVRKAALIDKQGLVALRVFEGIAVVWKLLSSNLAVLYTSGEPRIDKDTQAGVLYPHASFQCDANPPCSAHH